MTENLMTAPNVCPACASGNCGACTRALAPCDCAKHEGAGLPDALRRIADDSELLWNVARAAIEDELIRWRDDGMFVLRNNGFTVKYEDGSPSEVIRFGPEVGVRIALRALADHLEAAS